jgi:hypothetical protein
MPSTRTVLSAPQEGAPQQCCPVASRPCFTEGEKAQEASVIGEGLHNGKHDDCLSSSLGLCVGIMRPRESWGGSEAPKVRWGSP